jgi:penicillin amidase
MPRVQHRRNGASERMVVSPGREEQGLFHMPGGQSGHFWSRWFLAGHEDWAEGRPAALEPGAVVSRVVLEPGAR